MTLLSEIAGRRLGLPAARTRDVLVEADIPVLADDGTILLTNRYVARDAAAGPAPTVLVRSPYGRAQAFGLLFGRLLAERGFQVVVQSVRGTFGSGGEFTPFDERADGLATLRWLREQPWHDGRVGTAGMSYLGLTQWAISDQPEVIAMTPQLTASSFLGASYGGGGYSLDLVLTWMLLVGLQERKLFPLLLARALRSDVPTLQDELPLGDLDERALGQAVQWFRDWLGHHPDDEYWADRQFADERDAGTAAVQLLSGWGDLFTPWQFEDLTALAAAGRDVSIVVGPWSHAAPGALATGLRETIAFLRAHLLGDDRLLRPGRVRVHRTGADAGWQTFDAWPPADAAAWTWEVPGADRIRFLPEDPTPAVGGPVLLGTHPVVDNAPLEARADVVVRTGAVLDAPLELTGPVTVAVDVEASNAHFDVFARLNEVGADGVSRNVTDGLVRRTDRATRVEVTCWPVAHRFAAGSRLRLLLAGGAHPRFARNLGTDESPATATTGVATDLAFGPATVAGHMRKTP